VFTFGSEFGFGVRGSEFEVPPNASNLPIEEPEPNMNTNRELRR
jgi:hypothetical protein